jgi:molybdopterin synthase catalytic subunit
LAVASFVARRGPAFEASRYAIERIKEIVPIWKREVWSDGYVWVGSQVGTRTTIRTP